MTLAEPRERSMLHNIERLIGQKMKVAPVPTVMDLRARRVGLVSAAVRDAVIAGDLDEYVIELGSLAGDYDLMDIAAAAMKVAHDSLLGPIDEKEIARVVLEPQRENAPKREGHRKTAKGKKYDKPDRKRPAPARFEKKFDKKAGNKKGYPKRETGRRGNRPR